jgi:pimeloyl-ACP methyl ester carboxylesterase
MASVNIEGARERWVRTGGIELCVAELGDDSQPTVVLVHGYPDSKEVWSEVAERLAERFHVVLYDVRGHGRSTAPAPLRGGFTLEKLTDDFLAVADAVSPDRPVHLVGHDWGSVQGWEFATVKRTEGRIASFTSMSGPSLDHFGHWIKNRMSHPTPRKVGQLLGQGAKSWYVYMLHTPVLPELAWRGPLGRQWPKILRRLEKVPADGYPTASLPQDAAHGAWLYRDNVRARLRRPRSDAYAHVPVQLITPLDDAFLSPQLYAELEQWAPQLIRRTLPAKHWVPRTRPDQLAAWISEFVRANEWGVIHGCRVFGKQMAERGQGGHIVNTASAAAFQPSRALPAYSTSKAAVLMLSECLRAELAGQGIGVSAICPGLVNTNITSTTHFAGADAQEEQRLQKKTSRLYGMRNFPPEKVASAILRAVVKNQAVVPVTPEARGAHLMSRFAPRALRAIARLEPPL